MSFRDHPAFKILTRPIIAFAIMVGLFMLLFPNWGSRDLSVFYRLPPTSCASEVALSAFQGDALAHDLRLPIDGQKSVQATISLPRASYRIEVELGCPNGPSKRVAERSVDLHESQELSFDLSNKCPCVN
jgi:hypothetical protein